MPEVQTHPEKTTTPPAEPTRTRRWLPESRLLRWLLYIGVAIIAFNVTAFLVLLYFGTRPNLPYVDHYPQYRQLSIDAHARHGIAPPEPGQPDAWVILEGIRSRAEPAISAWTDEEEKRRAATDPPGFGRVSAGDWCRELIQSPGMLRDRADAPAMLDLIARLEEAGVWRFTAMLPTAAAALPTPDDIDIGADRPVNTPILAVSSALLVRARLAAESGDGAAALARIIEADAMADRFESQPSMLMCIVGGAIRSGIDETAIALTSARMLAPQHIEQLADLLAQPQETTVDIAINGERISALNTLQSVYYGRAATPGLVTKSPSAVGADPQAQQSLMTSWFFRAISSHRANADAINRIYDLAEQAEKTPFPAGLALDDALSTAVDEIPRRLVFAKILIGLMPRALLTARASAWEAAAESAVAIERYRLDHDALPTSLDDLVPRYLAAVPRDPFAPDSRLRYRRDADPSSLPGYTLYSVGFDQTDDNGAPAKARFDAMRDVGKGTDYLFVSNTPATPTSDSLTVPQPVSPPAQRPNP